MIEVTAIDTIRHISVFNPIDFGTTRVDVIGCGATGSRIAMSLAKLGILNLHLWDFDHVEGHNIANQIFGIADIGQSKVEALAHRIQADTGLTPTVHNERVDGTQVLGAVVFVLTDTMSSRKEIWEKSIRYRPHVRVMVETRMGVAEGRVYTINPLHQVEIDRWEATLCADEVAVESTCGSRTTVGPTAELVSGQAVWSFIRWWQHQLPGSEIERPASEYIFGVLSPIVISTRFE